MLTASRRITTWHPTPPPPPSPKILHFPRSRRARRKKTRPTTHLPSNPSLFMHQKQSSHKGKLENLFDRESDEPSPTHRPPLEFWNSDSKALAVERRERVEAKEEEEEEDCGQYNGGGGNGGFEEEKWRFQAEILRAECNFLRIERELALQKLEKNRVKTETTLRAAVQTLVSGRKKIFEGKNANSVPEEEIKDLAEKLEELQNSPKAKDCEDGNCGNFDKKACVLQRRLEKLGGLSEESCMKELQELGQSSLSANMVHDFDKQSSTSNSKAEIKSTDVDMPRKKMDELPEGTLDGMEEDYDSVIAGAANSIVASSASTSERIEFPEIFSFSSTQLYQEPILGDHKCSGRCKAVVRRIVEQVRAETEQWSQMQEMLRQVRGEMEELQASRDFWENRAHVSDNEIQALWHSVQEWKEKALGFENEANELKLEISALKEEIENVKAESNQIQTRGSVVIQDLPDPVSLGKQLQKEKPVFSCRKEKKQHIGEAGCEFEDALKELNIEESEETMPKNDLPPLSLGKQLAEEKRMLHHRLKENQQAGKKSSMQEPWDVGKGKPYSNSVGVMATERSPLRDIGNSSPIARQNYREAFPSFAFYNPRSSRTRETFRK